MPLVVAEERKENLTKNARKQRRKQYNKGISTRRADDCQPLASFLTRRVIVLVHCETTFDSIHFRLKFHCQMFFVLMAQKAMPLLTTWSPLIMAEKDEPELPC